MTIENMIKCCTNLTPIENKLAQYILENKEEIQTLTIENISNKLFISKAAVYRFCKKIGLNGFNELKVSLAKDIMKECKSDIDVNFPFEENDTQGVIAKKLLELYETSITDTYNSIDIEVLNKVVILLNNAEVIDIYTHAHNLNVAENFQDKMIGIGRLVNCPNSFYEQRCIALASNKKHVAIILSYSGKASYLPSIVKILNNRKVDIIYIGRVGNKFYTQYIKYNLYISDKENLKNRISQFSSHIAMQYILDVVFSCIFKKNYQKNLEYIREVDNFIDDREIEEEK